VPPAQDVCSRGIEFAYSLKFATCEFQACKPVLATYFLKQLLTTYTADVTSIIAMMRAGNQDGGELADHSSQETRWLGTFDLEANQDRVIRNWGYMEEWPGPSEFVL
jgi:hypothetical protein